MKLIFVLFFLISSCASALPLKLEEKNIKRSDFPPGFLFGVSTSAYQVEGGYLEDGKSLSNIDVFYHSPGGAENGDTADNHYHLFLEDIEIMYSLGLKAYRFSISWARILPRGRSGEVNPAGIIFYNKIIDNLILKGIEPFVTLYHYDFPQELEERYGSWLSTEMQEEFLHMADTCFKSFGDRVKYWATMNEPNAFVKNGYEFGLSPPARCSKPYGNCLAGNSDMEPLVVMHNVVLGHGKVAQLYHQSFKPKQGGLIGIIMACDMFEPLTDSELDHKSAKRAIVFNIGWVLDPVIFGDYPEEMREYLGSDLPSFSHEEKKFMKNSIDFIGINHYTTSYTKDCTNSSCSPTSNRAIEGFVEVVVERDGVMIGEPTGSKRLFVVPRGLEEIVNILKIQYNNTPMFITENGYSSPDLQEERVDVLLEDTKRIEFHKAYLSSLAKAIRGGADVRGYFVWSLLDNFEWNSGYKQKFGLVYVDHHTFTRTTKLSARWYKHFLTDNDLNEKERLRYRRIIRSEEMYKKNRCIKQD